MLYISQFLFAAKEVMECLIVAGFVFLWIIMPVVSIWLPIYLLLWTPFWWVMILYVAWMWYDWDTSKRGSRCWRFHRDLFVWRWMADYFPCRLIKTAELPPDRNYIIGSHPHGVLSVSAFLHLLTNGTGFSELFPGLDSILLTLVGQFYFPFRRDFGLLIGGAEASRSSLEYLLNNPGKGRAIGIVLGGLNEALRTRPGKHELKLENRRGFCKYALRYGADLVPMYHFGENEIFEQFSGISDFRLKNIQARIRGVIGFFPPLLRGRGLFYRDAGVLPFRRPITSVMGSPIHVDKIDNPTDRDVELLHSRYCDSLIELFETHKHLHNIPEDQHLVLY